MNLLSNGALLLGLVYIIAGISAIAMTIYLIRIHGNGLKSVLCHLFIAWAAHYTIIGILTLASFILGYELLPLNTLRLIATFFVCCQLWALYRLYLYIIK